MKASPKVTAAIGAHTDASGSASYNLRLSQRRATAVRSYLIGKGISASRLKARGYGETKLLNRCGRRVRCSDAEKRKNRRIELTLKGLPTDSAALAPWLVLAGHVPKKPVVQPKVPKMNPGTPMRTNPLPEANNSVPLPKMEQKKPPSKGDYFSELSEGKQTQNVPKPLPRSFAGYTIEIACTAKPVAAGAELLRLHNPVYLRQEAGVQYCYFVGAFFTLPEAQQFFQEKIMLTVPTARIVIFSDNTKNYVTQ
jgi:hypothetical protein